MTDKKPGLIEAALKWAAQARSEYEATRPQMPKDVLARMDYWLIPTIEHLEVLAHAKKREALVEAVVRESRRQLWSDFKACNRDCGHKDCDLIRALAALDRFDAGEGK